MVKENTFVIATPCFPGFYESYYLDSETGDQEIREEVEYWNESEKNHPGKDLTEEDFELDCNAYCEEICHQHVAVAFDKLNEFYPGLVEKAEFASIWSPREHNFYTDIVYAKITLCNGWETIIRKFMTDNKEAVTKRLADDWTSRSGFVSHLPNEFQPWYDMFDNEAPDTTYIAVILEYMLEAESEDMMYDICCGVFEKININEYIKRKEGTA